MKVVYTLEKIPDNFTNSIFLAGPVYNTGLEKSWRDIVIYTLKQLNYTGVVFIPEMRDGGRCDYTLEIHEWENRCIACSDFILMNLYKNIEKGIYGLTSNIEFGRYINSKKLVLNFTDSYDFKYMEYVSDVHKIPSFTNMYSAVKFCVENSTNCMTKSSGLMNVESSILNTKSFLNWYKSQVNNKNNLLKSETIFNYGSFYALKTNIEVSSESRIKSNEITIFRPDITSCVMYYEDYYVFVKEYRNSSNTKHGYVYEFPSGSSTSIDDMTEVIANEIAEEIGFIIDKSKLVFVNKRQILSTLLAHKNYLYKYELSKDEFDLLMKNNGKMYGNHNENEYTYLHITNQLTDLELDYSTLGMLFEAKNTKMI